MGGKSVQKLLNFFLRKIHLEKVKMQINYNELRIRGLFFASKN